MKRCIPTKALSLITKCYDFSSVGIDKTRTSGYAPWSNGQVERSNRSSKGILRVIGEAHPENWDDYIPNIRAAMNNIVQSSTGQTAHKVFFSRVCDAKMPIDIMACEQPLTDDQGSCFARILVEKEKEMCEVLAKVREHMNSSLKRQADNK